MPIVMVATPSLHRQLSADYTLSLLDTQLALAKAGIGFGIAILGYNPFIADARNLLANAALEQPNVTDLFYIDDDLGWPAQKVVEFVRSDVGVLAGVYPKKQDSGGWPVTIDKVGSSRLGGYIEAHLIPAGFLRIKRDALVQMSECAQKYTDPNLGKRIAALFEARVVGDENDALYWGEDYWFSQFWRSLGGQCWIDPDIDFKHTGSKTIEGNFSRFLQENRS